MTNSPQLDTPTGAPRWLWISAVVGFILTRAYLLGLLGPWLGVFVPNGTDAGLYFEYACATVDSGQTVYREIKVEYPPIAYWVIAAPRWMDHQRYSTRQWRAELTSEEPTLFFDYWRHFRWQMALFDVMAFALFLAIVVGRAPDRAASAAWGYVVGTAILGHMLYDRLDAGLLFLIVLWAFTWLRGSGRSEQSDGWLLASYFVLGLSIAYKLVPVVVLPLLLPCELWFLLDGRRTGQFRAALMSVAGRLTVFLVAVAVPFLLHMTSAGRDTFAFLEYHGERELEIESLWATLLMLLRDVTGLTIQQGHGHGSYFVESVDSPVGMYFRYASTVSLFCAYGALGIWALWQGRRFDRVRAFQAGCLGLCMLPILARVFSTQYLIWILPLVLLLGVELLSRLQYSMLMLAVLAIAAMTTWVFPYNFYSHNPMAPEELINTNGLIPALSRPACWMLIARNALYLSMIAYLAIALVRRGRIPSGAASQQGSPLTSA
jgi:hypothetical protein